MATVHLQCTIVRKSGAKQPLLLRSTIAAGIANVNCASNNGPQQSARVGGTILVHSIQLWPPKPELKRPTMMKTVTRRQATTSSQAEAEAEAQTLAHKLLPPAASRHKLDRKCQNKLAATHCPWPDRILAMRQARLLDRWGPLFNHQEKKGRHQHLPNAALIHWEFRQK